MQKLEKSLVGINDLRRAELLRQLGQFEEAQIASSRLTAQSDADSMRLSLTKDLCAARNPGLVYLTPLFYPDEGEEEAEEEDYFGAFHE
jgi:hypothetical protein